MMVKWKKSIAALAVVGMTLTGAAGVYAGANLQKITAYLNHGIHIKVNGKTQNDPAMTPITYKGTTYLPVRSIANALDIPVRYDAANRQVLIGSGSGNGESDAWTKVPYSERQLKEIKAAFAQFDGFEAAYAPANMTIGDAYKRTGASGDGVSIQFEHMTVYISPRDYSVGYDHTPVTLSNGTKAKWYTPDQVPMLGFAIDDRFVTISSPDSSLSKAQLEKIAVSVKKL